MQAAGGDVERHVQRDAGFSPGAQLLACRPADPMRQLVDEGRRFGEGNDSSGEIMPRSACCQRISASIPSISPESSVTFG
jgi:hypothetical protein